MERAVPAIMLIADFDRRGIEVAHLHLGDLLNGGLGNGGDLGLVGDAGTGLDVALLLDQDRSGRSLW